VTQSSDTEAYKTEYDKLFLGGKWIEPFSCEVIDVFSPATGEKSAPR
jgi:betaine-aldehyde dehydrogenase